MGFNDKEYRWIVDAPIEEFDGNIQEHRDKFWKYTLWLGYDINSHKEGLKNAVTDDDPKIEEERTKKLGKIAWQLQSGNIDGAERMLKMFQGVRGEPPLQKGRLGAAYMLSGRPVALFVFLNWLIIHKHMDMYATYFVIQE